MTDDIQKILDSISLVQDVTLASIGDKDAIARLKGKTDLPDSVKKLLEPPKPVEKGKPLPENFTDEIEYAKALLAWDSAMKAKADPATPYKKPVRENFLVEDDFKKAEAAYNAFITQLRAEIEPAVGEAVKKSLAPAAPAALIDKPIADIKKLYAGADAVDIKEFLYKEGVLR